MLTFYILILKILNVSLYIMFILESQFIFDRYGVLFFGILIVLSKIFIEKLLVQKCKRMFYKGKRSKFIKKNGDFEILSVFGLYMERGRNIKEVDCKEDSSEENVFKMLRLLDMTTTVYILESINILIFLISIYLDRDTRIVSIIMLISILLANSVLNQLNKYTTKIVVSSYRENISKFKNKKFRSLLKERTKTIEGQRILEIGNCSFTY